MCNLIAVICFLLALFGHDVRSEATSATRPSTVSGAALHSETRIIAGLINRECTTSASDSCYYVLFPCDCAADASGQHGGWRLKLRTSIVSS